MKLLHHVAVCPLFLAASWLFYAPARLARAHLFRRRPGSLAFIWFLNWWPFALTHHLPLLFTHYVDYPAGVDLVWKTSVPALGLLAAPFTLRFGAVAVFNVLMIAAPALSAFGLYLAAWELTGAFAASLLAGGGVPLFGLRGRPKPWPPQPRVHGRRAAQPLDLFARRLPPLVLLASGRGAGLAVPVRVRRLAGDFRQPDAVWRHPVAGARLAAPRATPHAGAPVTGIVGALALCLLLASPFIWAMLCSYHAEQANFSTPDVYANDLLAAFIPTPLVFFGGHLALPISKLLPAIPANRAVIMACR